jgi:hypothetical protein
MLMLLILSAVGVLGCHSSDSSYKRHTLSIGDKKTAVHHWTNIAGLQTFPLDGLAIGKGIGEDEIEGYSKKLANGQVLIVVGYKHQEVSSIARVTMPDSRLKSSHFDWNYYERLDTHDLINEDLKKSER